MKISLKKGTPECEIHNDIYKLHQDYGGVEDNPEYWDKLVSAIGEVSKKYRGTDLQRFTDTTLIALADYFNSKVAKSALSNTEAIATIIANGRDKEEIEAIIKALQKGVQG